MVDPSAAAVDVVTQQVLDKNNKPDELLALFSADEDDAGQFYVNQDAYYGHGDEHKVDANAAAAVIDCRSLCLELREREEEIDWVTHLLIKYIQDARMYRCAASAVATKSSSSNVSTSTSSSTTATIPVVEEEEGNEENKNSGASSDNNTQEEANPAQEEEHVSFEEGATPTDENSKSTSTTLSRTSITIPLDEWKDVVAFPRLWRRRRCNRIMARASKSSEHAQAMPESVACLLREYISVVRTSCMTSANESSNMNVGD